jgi:hypothetical protein
MQQFLETLLLEERELLCLDVEPFLGILII